MTIIEPSDNQDERSPLKKDVEINTTISSAALATAPPPYTSFPTSSPNPIPSSQAIPQNDDGPQPHRVILSHRPSPIRRFLAAFLVAWLVLFLWSAFVHSFNNVRHVTLIGNSHSHEYEVDTSRRLQLQKGIDDTGRVLPIHYPPIQLPQMTE